MKRRWLILPFYLVWLVFRENAVHHVTSSSKSVDSGHFEYCSISRFAKVRRNSSFINFRMLRSLLALPLLTRFTRLYASQVPLPHQFAMSNNRTQPDQNQDYIAERVSGELKHPSGLIERYISSRHTAGSIYRVFRDWEEGSGSMTLT